MDDPLITLYAALLAQWGGAIVPATADIRFSTSWLDKDIQTPQITVTEIVTSDEPLDLGYGTVRVNAVYQIDIWVTVIRATDEGPQLAKEYLWSMREEVKRILKANHTGLPGIELLLLNDMGRSLDEPDATPPILRFSQMVGVIYSI